MDFEGHFLMGNSSGTLMGSLYGTLTRNLLGTLMGNFDLNLRGTLTGNSMGTLMGKPSNCHLHPFFAVNMTIRLVEIYVSAIVDLLNIQARFNKFVPFGKCPYLQQ